jgi:hypothetical protein
MPSFIQYDREWNDIHEAAGYVNWGHIKYDIRICVELICGTVKSLEETLDLSRVPAGHNGISKFLVIEGWVAGYGLVSSAHHLSWLVPSGTCHICI